MTTVLLCNIALLIFYEKERKVLPDLKGFWIKNFGSRFSNMSAITENILAWLVYWRYEDNFINFMI